MQIGRRFYLPLRSWRENHEDPAGKFGELNSFERLISTGCPNKQKYEYKGFGQKFINLPRQKKRNFLFLAEKNTVLYFQEKGKRCLYTETFENFLGEIRQIYFQKDYSTN